MTLVDDRVRFRDIVKRVHVLRAEVVNPTVLASGVIALGVDDTSTSYNTDFIVVKEY